MVKSNSACELCALGSVGLTAEGDCYNVLCGLSYNLVEDEEEELWYFTCYWGNADEYALTSFTHALADRAAIEAGFSDDDVLRTDVDGGFSIPHGAGSSLISLLNTLGIPHTVYYEGQEVPAR